MSRQPQPFDADDMPYEDDDPDPDMMQPEPPPEDEEDPLAFVVDCVT